MTSLADMFRAWTVRRIARPAPVPPGFAAAIDDGATWLTPTGGPAVRINTKESK